MAHTHSYIFTLEHIAWHKYRCQKRLNTWFHILAVCMLISFNIDIVQHKGKPILPGGSQMEGMEWAEICCHKKVRLRASSCHKLMTDPVFHLWQEAISIPLASMGCWSHHKQQAAEIYTLIIRPYKAGNLDGNNIQYLLLIFANGMQKNYSVLLAGPGKGDLILAQFKSKEVLPLTSTAVESGFHPVTEVSFYAFKDKIYQDRHLYVNISPCLV